MGLNDSFSCLFGSPASFKKANDSFNESFGDKNTLTPSTIFRSLQKEHDQIASMLRLQPPTSSQYQNSLNELVLLLERAEDHCTLGFQKLILSVFLKISANILNSLGKREFQPTLYKLSQIIANSIVADISTDIQVEQEMLKKWSDRIVIESSIHLLEFPNFYLRMDFNIDNVVDDLGLANGRFQFIKSSIFENARSMASEMRVDIQISPESKFSLKNIADEHFLRLLLWLTMRQKSLLTGDLLPSLFPNLPLTPNADDLIQSPFSLLDLKVYLVSLSVVASTTTEAGMTAKLAPAVASSLALTKYQKDCWKAVVDTCAGTPATALSRLRTTQLLEAVRLTSDGSQDVRVLFEAWKCCLQPSAADDENVFEGIKAVTEVYRTKMNQILAYGPFYSSDPNSFNKTASSATRREMKVLFPLQFDYEFVDTTEAGHIGVVINSIEGYMSIANAAESGETVENEGGEVLEVEELSDDTFHSFATASDRTSSADHSQFFSPLKHNRDSMCPSAIAQRIRDESVLNSSHISTKSVILTPTRSAGSQGKNSTSSAGSGSIFGGKIEKPENSTSIFGGISGNSGIFGTPSKNSGASSTSSIFGGTPAKLELSFERLQNVDVVQNSEAEEDEDVEEEEEDELEVALRESTQKHEQSLLLAKQSPVVVHKTPTKDAQTETDDVLSSSESSIVSVKYTPRRSEKEELKKKMLAAEEEEEEEESEDEEEDSDLEDSEDDSEDVTSSEGEEEEEEKEIDHETMSLMMKEVFYATTTLFTDMQIKKAGLEHSKIKTENVNEDEIMRAAEKKLAKINEEMAENLKKLEKLSIVTEFPTVPLPEWKVEISGFSAGNLEIPEKSTNVQETVEIHDQKSCLGCQSDEKQEAALRVLEQLANDWDAEGNDYLFQQNYS